MGPGGRNGQPAEQEFISNWKVSSDSLSRSRKKGDRDLCIVIMSTACTKTRMQYMIEDNNWGSARKRISQVSVEEKRAPAISDFLNPQVRNRARFCFLLRSSNSGRNEV
jgi:hypothetical protein